MLCAGVGLRVGVASFEGVSSPKSPKANLFPRLRSVNPLRATPSAVYMRVDNDRR